MSWGSASLSTSLVALVVLVACGPDGAPGPSNPGTGGSGSVEGGGSIADSSGTGGESSGGSAGSGGAAGGAGGGAATVAGHCAPGVLHTESSAWDGALRRCYNYDAAANGVTPDPTLGVHQLELPEPMVAGAPYGLSVLVKFRTAGQSIAFWGTSGDCGHADEQLYTGSLAEGVLCMDLHPTQAHQAILMIWRGQGSIEVGDLTVCAHGKCP